MEFYVLVERYTDKLNVNKMPIKVDSVHVAGPFTKRSLAERAAAGAMSTSTCLGAIVFDNEEFAELANKSMPEAKSSTRNMISAAKAFRDMMTVSED